MATDTRKFHVRSATSKGDDVQFIVGVFDSTLPFLSSIGAGEMWGSEPFSAKEGFDQDIIEALQTSEANENSDERRPLIIEVEQGSSPDPSTGNRTRVGAAIIRDKLPDYLIKCPELKDEVDKGKSLLFIEVLLSDLRARPTSKGAGAALMDAVERRARASGKEVVYVDCWSKNDRKLNRYYENQGYGLVGDFSFKRRSGVTWEGSLYRKDLI